MSRPAFRVGDSVRVRAARPPGHVRTPWFVRGREGEIDAIAGRFANPEELAYGRSGAPARPLYRVRFRQQELFGERAERADDTVVVDLYEHWLEPTRGPR